MFKSPFLLSLLLIGVIAGGSAIAQVNHPAKEWTHLPVTPPDKVRAERWVQPLRGELFQLNHAAWRGKAAAIQKGEPGDAARLGTEIELPMPDGTMARFKIVEAPVMAPELAAKFPDIKTYAGQGVDDPGASVRLDFTPSGFHAQILSPRGAVYVDPAYRGDANLHVSYFKRDHRRAFDEWHCSAAEVKLAGKGGAGSGSTSGVELNKVQSGATLRTYQLAVAATGEYTAYHGGTVALGQAAIVTAIVRVNGVFETELAVRLTLVANNNLLVYTNSATDPYSNVSDSTTLNVNQTTIDAVIGSANYDIGHVFCTDFGGIAQTPSVCLPGKARGSTGRPSPTGDAFWIDFVAHEMGHQFGAEHTFNSETGSCAGGTREPTTAFEPGSGSTIMAYAGICSPNNLQAQGDPYFHAGSLDQIQTFITSGGGLSCATTSASGNTAPTVSAGLDYIVPASTPFMLTATGSDPNGDALTYCWEEMDLGDAAPLTTADQGNIPLFRSLSPTNNPVRYFPKLSSVLANTNWNQEKLPTTSRAMKFRVTARDNRVGGGGVTDDEMTVTSVTGTGPFVVTSPNTAVSWSNTHTVTWNVAGTTGAPINASAVNIHLSTNGGLTFTYLLATNTPNDGSQSITLPNISTSMARIRVQGAGNIFYDVSDVNFTILPYGPFLLLASKTLISESCVPTNGAVDPFETVTLNFALTNIGLAPTTNLVATLLASNGVYYPSAAQAYGAIPAGGSATRSFSFTPAGNCGGSVTGLVQLLDGTANMGTILGSFALGVSQVTLVTQVFANAGPITIPSSGAASPYPSTISVGGVSNVYRITATLTGLSHTYPDDIGILLAGPAGQTAVLMDSCGGGADLIGVNLTFDDGAAGWLPDNNAISSGTYRPTGQFAPPGSYPPPAPSYPYGTNMSAFAGVPNGTWSLYIADFIGDEDGNISGGWKVTIVSSNSTPACCTTFPAPTLMSTTYSNNSVLFNWNSLPGPHYQVQYRTNLAAGSWQNLGSPILGTNTTMGIADTVTNSPMRFYRVVVGP